jgi:sirohydrochlorin cobaltochelatase
MLFDEAALLLLGHGSTLNADSSAPTFQHAEEIRRRHLFAEVHVAFWKEEPNFRQALRQTARPRVYVVPNFISSGYFTEQIIPRELALTGPVTRLGSQEFYYCQPVGLHASMTTALLQRARAVVTASRETIADPAQTTCLFICGHGTSLNDNSTRIIHEQAALIRAQGLFADCQAVLMEQTPYVRDWRSLTSCPDVIVVPFFISDGLHSFEDIPVLLGLTHNIKEKAFTNPHRENGRRLWYATAVGTEPFISDVILAQISQFNADHGPKMSSWLEDDGDPIRHRLTAWLRENPPPWHLGEIAIRPGNDGAYELLHRDDLQTDPAGLRLLESTSDLRELVRLDDAENFRPLRAAPNLLRGWIHHALNQAGLQLAFDYLYPAALANWALHQNDSLPTTPWPETAERQTGRFRIVREIDDTAIHELVARVCQPGCLKKRLWSPTAQPVEPGPSEIPLLCPEACNYLVERAREKLKGPDNDPV